jgi:tRNA dimethylallyltransferase
MESKKVKPLIVIVGQTASGKTTASLELAEKINGEIICADSMTVYKGMDIGTAKPTLQEQQRVRHHLLDIMLPNQPITVAEFKTKADDAILDIVKRGKVPILVGGSGLYINAVIYNYSFRPVPNEQNISEIRRKFGSASVETLLIELTKRGLPIPENSRNHRYLLRTLESGRASEHNDVLRPNTLVVGINLDRAHLEKRIRDRIDTMVNDGLIDELKSLLKQYGPDIASMQASAYRAFTKYVNHEFTLKQATEFCAMLDMKLAKKQHTWFKRNKSIHWVDDPSKIVDLTTTFLNK